jgi:hypothetical protein
MLLLIHMLISHAMQSVSMDNVEHETIARDLCGCPQYV